MRGRMGGMRYRKLKNALSVMCGRNVVRWWKDKTPPDPEIQEANAFVCAMAAVFLGVCWLFGCLTGSVDWQTGLIALASLAAAMFIWWRLRVQFSLRSMLIATTLFAVVLGVIVWLR
jgi:hypothetical protein